MENGVYPRDYREFLRLFNAERFWEAHEVLEGPWRENRSHFYKGLIIYASAFVHVQRGNPAGVRKQMDKVLRYLPPYRPRYMGLDVDALLADAWESRNRVAAAESELAGLSPGDREEALRRLVPFPRLLLSASCLRGDEPELNREAARDAQDRCQGPPGPGTGSGGPWGKGGGGQG